MRFLIFFIYILISSPYSFADEPSIKLAIGEARIKKSKIAFPNIIAGKNNSAPNSSLNEIHDIITEDLLFSGLFDFIQPSAFLEKADSSGIALGSFKFSDWSTIGTQFLLKSQGQVIGKDITLEIYLYMVNTNKIILSKRYSARTDASRKLSHTISNDVFFALTNMRGPFTSKIAFVSDYTGKKEVYIMDYDGYNRVQVTNRKSVSIAPSWSNDGKSLLFSAVAMNSKNIRNHNLYRYELTSGTIDLLSNKKGLNSGAVYSPDGSEIALTMSFTGNPEIFIMNPKTLIAKKITDSFGMDVDPSYSPDGKQLAFVSDRSNRPMIYKMDAATGDNVKRLTFDGYYNAAPSWSPTGNKIAFAGWNDNHFDIFIMNPDGSNIERLTKNMGNNEDPHFAPDGYFIAYSSNRGGKRNIYITNIDNTVHRQITSNYGNCEAPKWSPVL